MHGMHIYVTKFTCGGFALGFTWHHSLADGIGAAQFLNAVGELARGLPRPTVDPSKPFLVAPSKPTPRGKLPLSPIDKIQRLRFVLISSIHVFAYGDSGSVDVEIVNTIKQATSEALVLYYPLAGRLVDVGDGDLCIECNGEGVGFIEASADCSLEDVNFLEHPSVIPLEELVVDHRGWRVTDPPIIMQVTKFTCGGFALGFTWHHSLADGAGAAQFLNAVGELARGLPRPTVDPVWARDSLLDLRPNISSLPSSTPNLLELECSELNVPLDYINQTKENFFRQTGQSCTAFDIALATIWQCRTRAIGLEPTEPVRVYFAVNVREMLQAQPGYYGNSIFIQTVSSTSQEIAEAPIVEIIKIIRYAKGTVSTELAKWKKGLLKDNPMEYVDFSYNTLGITYWKNLGFEHVDYGSGKPLWVTVHNEYKFVSFCILGLPHTRKNGVYINGRIVKKEHLEAFCEEMKLLKQFQRKEGFHHQ
ncbi:3'-N-debenzoyl-2'-deoxytaxol N-benzoyltransferase [Ananas comosus]|uniref:3'-N-debenzoyl-2'-deoxytaxol N-benzoyltransferase n=1 Tax=Ananas comosus TaxID=4615 RepID=A0A199UI00_ANACO|nr:3'-N-debenzoyl-2'-deoxytaxol N-benzoyltransferase [Ananas comosus]